jgi:hypothetical protein
MRRSAFPLAANVPTDEMLGFLGVSAHFPHQQHPGFKPSERFVPTPVRNVPNSFISNAIAMERSPLFASIVDGSPIAQSLNKVHGSLLLCEIPQGCHALFVANVHI